MSNEIIVIKQLPEIEERLQEIKADVTQRVNEAKSLACTEETVKDIKNIRTTLNKEFAAWEEKRKEVKKAIMRPYEQFDERYKECIADLYKTADTDLKSKIEDVERQLKANKEAEVRTYLEEYLLCKGIDFVTFENANINITLSVSKKNLKEQAKAFVDRISDDLSLIGVQEHKDEILFLYKKVDGFSFLNASKAITFVAEKYKAIEEEKARAEERQAREEAIQKAAEKVETIVETLTPPTVEPIMPPTEEEKILTLRFAVKGTLPQLKALKEFLTKNNYDFKGE